MQHSNAVPPTAHEAAQEQLNIPEYELREPLGAGGYGTVFLARQRKTGALVAIKVVKLTEDTRRIARFHRETELCARLRHPHIVQLLDKGRQGPYVYGVFEYVPGETLKSLIQRSGALTAVEAARIMAEVLDALDCAHKIGIVHRDLKPDNVMLMTTGAISHAKVLDFGISTVVPQARDAQFSSLTMTDECLGTPSYSAPEQLRGELPSVQSDLYAWGLMFLECLTGAPVMNGTSTAEIFHQQLSSQEVPLPPEIAGHPLASLLRRALKKRVAERSASAEALLLELGRIRMDDLVGTLRSERQPLHEYLAQTVVTKRSFSEKRQVTVLCCSVSIWPPADEYAALGSDIEDLELLQRQEFSLFVDAATRRGGLLAGTLGERMLILFGYPRASDADARQAGMTALELAQLGRCRAAAIKEGQGAHLMVRMGLHTGMVVVSGDEIPSGHAVNIAMRLEGQAPAGAILASENCYQLLRNFAHQEEAEGLRLPAPSVPLRTYRLTGEHLPTTFSHTPIPYDALLPPQTCVGRERELEQLWQFWEQVRQGTGSAVLLSGEAGIGKSRLVEVLRERVERERYRSIGFQCLPEHRNNALAPILPLLRQQFDGTVPGLAAHEARDRLQDALSAAGCDAPRVLPIFCSWLSLPFGPYAESQISPALQKALLLQSIARWLLHQARSAPLLILVEDLHWVDPTTIELLEQISVALPRAQLLLVLSARTGWDCPAVLQAEALPIARLDDEQAAQIARQVLAPKTADPAVIDNIVARTDGVPLFVHELTRMLRDTYLVERSGMWFFKTSARPTDVPVTLRDSLISRFDRLGPVKELLQLAATIGRQFDVELLQSCSGKTPQSVTDGLATLLDAGLIARAAAPDSGSFVFRHGLIRDAAYECMLAVQRRQQHWIVAQTLTRLYPLRATKEPGSIARHYAAAGDYVQAVAHAIQQLRITQHRALNDETIAYAELVDGWIDRLDGVGQREARLDLNGYVTQAMMNKHGWAHVQVKERIALSQALLTGTVATDKEVQHLWSMITYHHVASNREEVRQLSYRLLDLAGERHDTGARVAAHTYLGLAHYSDGNAGAAERVLTQAIEGYSARAHAHHASYFGFDTRVWAAAGRALVRWSAGEDALAQADAANAVGWARALSHIPSLGMALLYQSVGYQHRGDKQAALRSATELLNLAARYGLPAFAGYAEAIRCWAVGEIEQADDALLALWQMGCAYCHTYYRSLTAEVLAEQGRWAEAIERIDGCLQLADQLKEGLYSAELHLKKAQYLRATGSPAAAVGASLLLAARLAREGGKLRVEFAALEALQALCSDHEQIAERLKEIATARPEWAPQNTNTRYAYIS
ncbi:TOMM system kinase/cyclase fusion protein [Xylophilus sp. GW821-FHT01B05]